MHTWSNTEKKIARRAYDAALDAELASVIEDLKTRAAAVTEPVQVWELERHLRERRRDIDQKYDFRYSVLEFVLGRLLGEGWIERGLLDGLGEDKLSRIEVFAGLRDLPEVPGRVEPSDGAQESSGGNSSARCGSVT